ncbi:MAG: energy-coupling factor transporter transmembrane protein EcfT [Desulfobacterales bacterium]|nr:energy-coupling factor transporter transmembrane protein EcfT [Desulfobacterales bacterium]
MTLHFAELSSPVHKTAPTVRVVTATVFSVVTALASEHVVPLFALVLSLGFVLGARLPLTAVAKRLIPLTGFLVLIWLVLPLTGAGDILKKVGPFSVTSGGTDLAVMISLKSYAIVLTLMALVSTMHPFVLGHALGVLGMPEKLVFLLVMTSRYITVFEAEYKKLWNAARIRGFCPDTSLHTYRTVAYLVGMLLVRSHLRAGRVHKAMVLRGFDGTFHRMEDPSGSRLGHCIPQTVCMGLACLFVTTAEALHLFVGFF